MFKSYRALVRGAMTDSLIHHSFTGRQAYAYTLFRIRPSAKWNKQ